MSDRRQLPKTDCPHEQTMCIITMTSATPAEPDDGVYVLMPDDFDDPGYVSVELCCSKCGRGRLLDDNEWEVA